jgi:hypothetical protein
MRLGSIVLKLRRSGTRFGDYIGGAIELEESQKRTPLRDLAFVIPLKDDAGANQNENEVNQSITERFGVVVALKNDHAKTQKYGVISYDTLHDVRQEFFDALLGWLQFEATDFIKYRGGRLINVYNSTIWYQFEFEYDARIIRNTLTTTDRETQTQRIYEVAKQIGLEVSGQLNNGKYMGLTAEQITALIPDMDQPVDWLKVYMQIVDFGVEEYEGDLPKPDNYPNVEIPDMANMVDMSNNPNDGAYKNGFGTGFDLKKD